MSSYTTELRKLVEQNINLGMTDYPIFNEEYRASLNTKIINHYYYHEIGFETIARFKHYLNTTLNEIMPYYNKLLQSELITINPLLSFQRSKNDSKTVGVTRSEDLHNTDTKEATTAGTKSLTLTNDQTLHNVTGVEGTKHNTGTNNITTSDTLHETNETENTAITTNSNTNTNNHKDIFSETPQALLTDTDIATNYYASEVHIVNDTNSNNTSDTVATTNNLTKDVTNSGTNNNTLNLTNTDNTTTTSNGTNNTVGENNETTTETDNETLTKVGTVAITEATNETIVVTENGFEIPLSDLVLKYRSTFLNIDTLIINDLKELFMMVY